MSITCTHCGRDIQTDDELSQEVIEESQNIVVMPAETITEAKKAITLLSCMVIGGTSHTDFSIELVENALNLLGKVE